MFWLRFVEQTSQRGEDQQNLMKIFHSINYFRLLLPTVLGMAGDSVANVRFNVAKTIQAINKVLPAAAIQVNIFINC